jgi:hypothetical protein
MRSIPTNLQERFNRKDPSPYHHHSLPPPPQAQQQFQLRQQVHLKRQVQQTQMPKDQQDTP